LLKNVGIQQGILQTEDAIMQRTGTQTLLFLCTNGAHVKCGMTNYPIGPNRTPPDPIGPHRTTRHSTSFFLPHER